MKRKILFVSHKKAQCGIYEFGKNVSDVLDQSSKYDFIRLECSSLRELSDAIAINNPDAILYNYAPQVLPWLTTRFARIFHRNNIASIKIPQIGIIHEVTQSIADKATAYRKKIYLGRSKNLINSLFDFYVAPDPTLLLWNNLVYKTGRLIQAYQNSFPDSQEVTIGSFGFATPGKGFEKIVQLVQQEFDQATIRFNIPAADFGDKNGVNAKAIEDRCKALITKDGIALTISHDFLDNTAILDFLAKNTINVFLYEAQGDRGLSSTIDYAMATGRPIAVSDSMMFRHIFDVRPSARVSENSIRMIIKNGFTPLRKHYEEWDARNLLWDYERIMDSVFEGGGSSIKTKRSFLGILYSTWNKLRGNPDRGFTWLRNSEKATDDDMEVTHGASYTPVLIPQSVSLNRILDNDARVLYKPAIDIITTLVPETISKKIPEANVQQGFVFDTVCRYIPEYKSPKILCVGSYEDTASMSLKKMGVKVEEIDPMLNYSLEEYVTKPTTIKNSYDIIFSTSVIEHDPQDELFINCVAQLLAPGGVFIMTCDFKEGWKSGDPKPEVDARLYTEEDLINRFLPLMRDCNLVDVQQWHCPNPDFKFGEYTYAFATFVIKKKDVPS